MAGYLVLVVAKAPVPGIAKTRLTPPATPHQAARIASAALLDTLDAVLATPGAVPMVAMTGTVANAVHERELRAKLASFEVFDQRGQDFAERLANAHVDAAARRPGLPIVQVGMDTPQLTPSLLDATQAALAGADAVLGPAEDGGWWSLGLRKPADARLLRGVPMSTPDTCARTKGALSRGGLRVSEGSRLSDVDLMSDAVSVAALIPGSRFASAVGALSVEPVSDRQFSVAVRGVAGGRR